MKTCSTCKKDKNLQQFHRDRSCRDGFSSRCKSCAQIKAKRYRARHREKLVKQSRNWHEQHPNYRSDWEEANRDSRNRQRRKRWATDVQWKLKCNIRHRVNLALKNAQKAGSAVEALGCSVEELRVYLESKFQPGMTWENWGLHGWHIDHVVPLSKFDLSDPLEYKKACHYTNLQPLWAFDNLQKGAE